MTTATSNGCERLRALEWRSGQRHRLIGPSGPDAGPRSSRGWRVCKHSIMNRVMQSLRQAWSTVSAHPRVTMAVVAYASGGMCFWCWYDMMNIQS